MADIELSGVNYFDICGEYVPKEKYDQQAERIKELEEALEEIEKGMDDSDDDYYSGWTYRYKLIAQAALKNKG